VAPSPKWEALRFASIVPHNLPCRERFAERFSEDVFGFSKTCFYNLTALPVMLSAKVSANTSYRQARMNSRNLTNITIREARRQRRSRCISLSSNLIGTYWKHCAELAEKLLNLYTQSFPE
jgi:hypothetical protein